jgi:hypothetical protein
MCALAFLLLLTPPEAMASSPAPAAPNAKTPFDAPRCGQACFYLIAKLKGKPLAWEDVKRRLGDGGPTGIHSFDQLAKAGQEIGLYPRGVTTRAEELRGLPLPAIAVLRGAPEGHSDHFTVLLRAEPQGAVIIDAPYSPEFLDWGRFAARWSGQVLVFCHSADEASALDRRLAWHAWLPRFRWPLLGLGVFTVLALGFLGRRPVGALIARSRLGAAVGAGLLAVTVVGIIIWQAQPRWLWPLPPRCVIVDPEQDLGEFTEPTRKHFLVIRNDGDAPLAVKKVHSNCGCVVSPMADPIIAPGETGTLSLELAAAPGPRRVLVTLETNDPARFHTAQLVWSGPSRPTLHPVWIEETAPDMNQGFTRSVQLFYPGGRNAIKPELVGFEGEGLRVDVASNDAEAEQYFYTGFVEKIIGVCEMRLTLPAPAEPGLKEIKGTLKFRYGKQDLAYPITVRVRFGERVAARE